MSGLSGIILKVSSPELLLLGSFSGISPSLRARFSEAVERASCKILLSLEEVDDLREILMQEVIRVGFDEHYELNSKGRLLQDLADRLYEKLG